MLKFQQTEMFTKNYSEILKRCQLFNGIQDDELSTMLGCLGAKVKSYAKEQIIFCEGDEAQSLGIVLSGEVQITRIDLFGNRTILARIEPSQLFGESFACANVKSISINVVASVDAEIMLIDAKQITRSCKNACAFHSQMIFNLLKVVAEKNIILNEKIEITSKRSTREKLFAYLFIQARKWKKDSFTIPYSRQELADYLEVERSGLSAEISKMKKEGLIENHRSNFSLLRIEGV